MILYCGFNFHSLNPKDEHPFMCLLAVHVSFFVKYLFKSSAYFLLGYSYILLLTFMSSLYIMETVFCQL